MRFDKKRYKDRVNAALVSHYNKIRKRQGLPLLEIKIRQCLRCDKEFESVAHDNRMCYECREKRVTIFTDETKCGY